jgi:hypothetical protein
MLLDKEIIIEVKSSRTIFKLKELGIISKIGDIIALPINELWLMSNIKINVRCDICNVDKIITYCVYNKNYMKYKLYCCSNKCSSIKNKMTCMERYGDENYNNPIKSKSTKFEKYGDENYINIKKIKKTSLERYGDENYNNRVKFKSTCLEKYGVINPLLSDAVKEKTRKTNLERYGVEDPRTTEYVKNKRNETNLERYGVTSYSNTNEYKERIKITSNMRYGFDSPNKSKFIKDKKVKSMLKKYGYISNSITEESKEKLRNTNLERYGVEYPMQVLEFFEKQQKSSKKLEYYNDKLYFQGSYERDFLEYMYKLGMIDFVERGPYIKYNYLGESKRHYPDFFIPKFNLIIEIKSSYYYNKFLEMNNVKMNECIKIGYNYIFIINKNYSIIESIFNNEYKRD